MGSPHAAGARSPLALLLGFAVAAALLAAIEIALLIEGPVEEPWSYSLMPLVGLVYCLAGLLAWARRPSNRTCALLTCGGLAWFAAALGWVGEPALIAIGQVFALLPVAITIHLLFAFPSGRLETGLDRAGAVAVYVVALPLQAPTYLFGGEDPPFDVLEVADLPGLADAAGALRAAIAWAVSVVIVIALRRRLGAAGARQRRALWPFAAYGVLALIVIPVVTNLLPLFTELDDPAVRAVQLLVLAGVPVAAVATMLRGGFARTGAIEELAAWLGESRRTELREALAAALGDGSLGLGFPVRGGVVDGAGRPHAVPEEGEGRGVCEVALEGRTVARIDYDPTAIEDRADVEAAASVVAIWIERERLTAALLASDAELRRSRLRVIEAADEERRRIARDLHDGLGSRLLLHSMRVDRLLEAPPAAGLEQLRELRAEAEAAVAELRGLVAGVMPAALVEGGLEAALDDLATRSPLPVSLCCVGVERLAPELESTVYFVVAEALSNAIRHAGASRIRLAVRGSEGGLAIEVADDGRGGVRPGAGAGVDGMADRIEAYGGRLSIESGAAGTTIRATFPGPDPSHRDGSAARLSSPPDDGDAG